MATIKGGDKLAAALAKISKGVSQPALLRVGFLENARYPDGKSVAMIAAIQDFGAPGAGIPPRPFFRNMVAAKKGEWPAAIAGLLKANDYDAVKALGLAGEAIGGQLRQSIINTNSPALAASTLRKRGVATGTVYDPKKPETFRAKPLIDTGHMINSIGHEVKT
jgi:hypothetical protein